MRGKWLFITGLIIVMLSAGWLYYLYQKPRADVAAEKAAHSITAEKIYHDFLTDETAADQMYTDKIIEVSGEVLEAQTIDNTDMVLLAAGSNTGGINCRLNNSGGALPVKGEMIKVKGKCTGFLMDVNLVDGVVIK